MSDMKWKLETPSASNKKLFFDFLENTINGVTFLQRALQLCMSLYKCKNQNQDKNNQIFVFRSLLILVMHVQVLQNIS